MIWLPCDRLFCWWSLNFVIQTLLLLLIMCSVFLIIKLLSLSFIAAYIVYCVDNGWCHVVPLVARPWSTPLNNIHLFYTLVVPLALSFGVWSHANHLRNWITPWVNIHMFYTLVVWSHANHVRNRLDQLQILVLKTLISLLFQSHSPKVHYLTLSIIIYIRVWVKV